MDMNDPIWFTSVCYGKLRKKIGRPPWVCQAESLLGSIRLVAEPNLAV